MKFKKLYNDLKGELNMSDFNSENKIELKAIENLQEEILNLNDTNGTEDFLNDTKEGKLFNKEKWIGIFKGAIVCIFVIILGIASFGGVKAYLKSVDVATLLQTGNYDKAATIINKKIEKNSETKNKYTSIVLAHLDEIYNKLNDTSCTSIEAIEDAEQKIKQMDQINVKTEVKANQEKLISLIESRKAFYKAYVSSSYDEMINLLDQVITHDKNYNNVQNIKLVFESNKKIKEIMNKDYEDSHEYFAETMFYYNKFRQALQNANNNTIPQNFKVNDFKDAVLKEVSPVKYSFYSLPWDKDVTYIISHYLKDYSSRSSYLSSIPSGIFLNNDFVFKPIFHKTSNNITVLALWLSSDINEDDVKTVNVLINNEKHNVYNSSEAKYDIFNEMVLHANECLEYMVEGFLNDETVNVEIIYNSNERKNYSVDNMLEAAILDSYTLNSILRYDGSILEEI